MYCIYIYNRWIKHILRVTFPMLPNFSGYSEWCWFIQIYLVGGFSLDDESRLTDMCQMRGGGETTTSYYTLYQGYMYIYIYWTPSILCNTYTHIYIHIYIHAYIEYIYTRHIYIYLYTRHIYIYLYKTYIYIHIYIYIYKTHIYI